MSDVDQDIRVDEDPAITQLDDEETQLSGEKKGVGLQRSRDVSVDDCPNQCVEEGGLGDGPGDLTDCGVENVPPNELVQRGRPATGNERSELWLSSTDQQLAALPRRLERFSQSSSCENITVSSVESVDESEEEEPQPGFDNDDEQSDVSVGSVGDTQKCGVAIVPILKENGADLESVDFSLPSAGHDALSEVVPDDASDNDDTIVVDEPQDSAQPSPRDAPQNGISSALHPAFNHDEQMRFSPSPSPTLSAQLTVDAPVGVNRSPSANQFVAATSPLELTGRLAGLSQSDLSHLSLDELLSMQKDLTVLQAAIVGACQGKMCNN